MPGTANRGRIQLALHTLRRREADMRTCIAVLALLVALSPALATDGQTTSEHPERTRVEEEPPAQTGERIGRPEWESEVDPGEPCDDHN